MSERQMHDQCRALVGKVVVYSVRIAGSDGPYLLHAGLLEEAGAKYKVRASVANNHLNGVQQHAGPEQEYPLPAEGYEYSRVLEAAVHQTEQAVAIIAELRRSNTEKDQQLQALQQQLSLLLKKVEDLSAGGQKKAAQDGDDGDAAVVFPADAEDVKDWVDEISTDPHRLIFHLESRYLSGMAHLPGGEQLEEAFHSLRLWIMGVAYFDGWQGTPQRQAGNNLHNYVRHNVPRRELKTELAKQGEGMSGPVCDAEDVGESAMVDPLLEAPGSGKRFGRCERNDWVRPGWSQKRQSPQQQTGFLPKSNCFLVIEGT
ncbi:hypothetical protein DIPPA_32510 [Diplonema papillatum]|nr:hypothetical protein DIPPA_32510 [Diplonema papillatum]